MAKRSFTEVIEGAGFRLARVGRLVSLETHRTPAEQQALLANLAKYHGELPETIRESVSELETLIEKHDPLDIIANVAHAHLANDPETYEEYLHEGQQAHVEYIALLCLKHPYRERDERLVNGPELEKIMELVHSIFRDTLWFYGTEAADPERNEPPNALQEIRFRTIINELLVRNPGYRDHVEDLLKGLFGGGPAGPWMETILGFTIDEAIRFSRAIASLIGRRLNDRLGQTREMAQALRRQVRAYSRSGEISGEVSREILERFAKLNDRKLRRESRNFALGWYFFALGDAYSFSVEELAKEANTTAERAQAFLSSFSIGFGSISRDFCFPQVTHPLQVRPIIHHPRGYLCPAPNMLHWAIRLALEGMLNPGTPNAKNTTTGLWESYQVRRATFLVDESLRLLGNVLRRATCYRGLRYPLKVAGTHEEGELDGLVLFDTIALLVEAKAGQFSVAARRGGQARMLRDLRSLVAEPHQQALRAMEYIRTTDQPLFKGKDGITLRFDKTKYRTTFLVTVTTEPLDTFVTTLYKLKELGIFAAGELPWAVQILDLRIISELIEYPSQFVHYLVRRLRLNELAKVVAHDELDWLGHYLHEGLYFEDLFKGGGPSELGLTTYTTDMDSYYLYLQGERKTPARKPRQPMPDVFRQIIEELEKHDGEGYVTVAATLLDIGSKARKQLGKYVELLRGRSARDGKIHDFSMLFGEGRFGITVMSGKDHSAEELMARLRGYAELKKYQQKCERWVAIGTVTRLPGIVHAWTALDHPWVHDPNMEETVQKVFGSGVSSG